MLALLNEIDHTSDLLYKKYDFYSYPVTGTTSVHDILAGRISRQYNEIRKFKSQLSRLFDNPYWEDTKNHLANSLYIHDGVNFCGYSIAEACERDKVLVSFVHPKFSVVQLLVQKDGIEVILDNLFDKGHYNEVALRRKTITFETYCNRRFDKTKLNFTLIDAKEGFTLITKENEGIFLDGFRKFAELPWENIPMDDALDYKEYNNKTYFKNIPHQIRKFRISQKYRCFGYVERGVFYVLLFDLDHKLSDKG